MILGLIISGIIGGLLGGMGMGGGTLLIPIITILFGVEQHVAQAANLISFIPMSIVAIYIHSKKGLLKIEGVLLIIIFGIIFCVVGCYIASIINGQILKRIFGGFLILLSFYQFYKIFIKKNN
ncbi:MAG: sulfite exporter TauE/SafE family protein [Clostridia bacterium]|nr:sulfite exporter TauE/SafE family protein [Clostridia bacterium]